ncbi:MAG: glucan biosynthesis protein G [Burkholderiales bacterium]|nr:glucan biosynthesis protein G [Burkholderiales bacterium]
MRSAAFSSLCFRAALLGFCALAGSTAFAFAFEDVANKARALAEQPYKPPTIRMPKEVRELDYDQYRDIRFRPEKSIWRAEKLPFELMLFLQGRAVSEPVALHLVEPSGERPLAFDPQYFDFGKNRIEADKLRDLDYNGFRVHYAVNKPGYKDEVLVFQGASYFRALGKGQSYGLSARGLAVDTAAAGGEEFPRFVEFWIERPRSSAGSLVVHALLDSKRVAGAYRFVLTPGSETTMQVTARLFLREKIAKLGLAPLTSMFAFGENQPGRDDYRPEVHDSDGLSIQGADGAWIWRPLVNPKRLLVTSFAMPSPRGFGLMQRDRSPASYEDPEALYERRPSAWVEPIGNWGDGRVELVQIPTPDETNDNIVAYWVPQTAPVPGKAFDFSYRIRWQTTGALPADKAWVVQTRRGRGFAKRPDGDINFVVDFDGPPLRSLAAGEALEPVIWVDANAEVRERNLFRNPVSGAWRMTVRIKRADAAKPVELRAYLKQQQTTLSETWSYILPAEPDKP